MPELPEVEHLRRSLEPHLVGARIAKVRVYRRDIVRIAGTRKAVRGVKPAMLLEGDHIARLIRRGKSMAIVGESGGVLGVHLGMTGMMRVEREEASGANRVREKHVHCSWTLVRDIDVAAHHNDSHIRPGSSHRQPFALWFRDPRRFGGLYPFASIEHLHAHAGGWARLGPDALDIDAATVRERLRRTSQPIKAALLNQALVAGVGNIYADESLFAAGIHPKTKPKNVRAEQWEQLAESIVQILRAAIDAGGSSISDYLDAQGEAGSYGGSHRVYGRGGQPCLVCGQTLRACVVGQRTTVFCGRCQKRGGGGHPRRALLTTCPQGSVTNSRKQSCRVALVS